MLWGGDDDDLFSAIWSLNGANVEHVVSCGGVTFQNEEDMTLFALRWHDHKNAHYDKVQSRVFLMPPHPWLPINLDDLHEVVDDLMPGRTVVTPVTYASILVANADAAQRLSSAVAQVASRNGFEHEATLTAFWSQVTACERHMQSIHAERGG